MLITQNFQNVLGSPFHAKNPVWYDSSGFSCFYQKSLLDAAER